MVFYLQPRVLFKTLGSQAYPRLFVIASEVQKNRRVLQSQSPTSQEDLFLPAERFSVQSWIRIHKAGKPGWREEGRFGRKNTNKMF